MFGHIRIYNCFYVLGAKNRSRVRKVVQGFLWLVFPANIYAARKNISYKDERDRTDSVKQHVIRLPLQFVMVARNYYKTYHSHAWNITFVPGDFNIYT